MIVTNESYEKDLCVIAYHDDCCSHELVFTMSDQKLVFKGKGVYDCNQGSYFLPI